MSAEMMRGVVWEKKPADGSSTTGQKDYDLIVKEYPKPSFDPEREKGKVLVRVKAAANNPIDCKVWSFRVWSFRKIKNSNSICSTW